LSARLFLKFSGARVELLISSVFDHAGKPKGINEMGRERPRKTSGKFPASPPPTPPKPPGKEKGVKQENDNARIGIDLKRMLETIAVEEIDGWKSLRAILNDPRCPLVGWLQPFYARALQKAEERMERIKNREG
jgi:hypothetical protein